MKDNNFSFIECNSLQIATSFESSQCTEHNVYFPFHILFLVRQGEFCIHYNGQQNTIKKNSFCLVRKNTSLSVLKSWDKHKEDGYKMITFILNDDFIKKVAIELPVVSSARKTTDQPFLIIPSNTVLLGLMSSLDIYIQEKKSINPEIVELKTLESLIGLAQSNAGILSYLNGVSHSEKADLHAFMGHYYRQNLPLDELARLSGRSIASFHRDFKRIFNTSPHKWIKQRRLLKAKELLTKTSQKPSDIYLSLGFEDLAHFSRSFKQFFGKNPSEIASSLPVDRFRQAH